ncbi:MAG: DUF4177 domain-containing protein [Synergistaceae bacterium]|jgi:hypothetical protein|nr:DUF4177 domain-containing protein [Synergistaceae bacterium]
MKRTLFLTLALALAVCGTFAAYAQDVLRYEYKIVPLNSLTPLQKKAEAVEKQNEIEEILNKEGLQGWEMVSIFAVRTTFDPNVFFVAMKRPLPDFQTEEKKP